MHCQFGNSLGTGVSENGLAEKEKKRRRGSRLFDLTVLAVSSVSAPEKQNRYGIRQTFTFPCFVHGSLSSLSTKGNLAEYLMNPFVEFDACIPQIIILPWRTHAAEARVPKATEEEGFREKTPFALSHPSSSSSPHRRRRSIDFSIARKEEQCAFFPPPLDTPPLLPQGGFRRSSVFFSLGVFRSMCLKSYGVAAKRGRMIQKVALAVRPASVVDPEAKPPLLPPYVMPFLCL